MKREARHIRDEWLVLKAQDGDVQAIGTLLERHQAALLRHAARLTGRREASRDIWQESAMAISGGIRRLRDPAVFRTWAYRITTSKCRDWQRRMYREKTVMAPATPEAEAKAATAEDRNSIESVRAVLNRFTGDEKALLSLFYIEGFDVREISGILDISIPAVKTRLFRARARFRSFWEGDQP